MVRSAGERFPWEGEVLMRYDTPIYFQLIESGEYDKTTGDYKDDTITEEKRFASVTDAGNKTLSLLYGEIREGSIIARIQRGYEKPFDRIRIGKKVYRCDLSRKKRVFIMSEVQANG